MKKENFKRNTSAIFFSNTDNNNNDTNSTNIFTHLKNIDRLSLQKVANDLATSAGLYDALIKYVGSFAHIIHPDLSSISALLSDNKEERCEAAVNYAKTISGFETNGELINNGIIHQDGGQLTKPIVMLLNTTSAKPTHQTDTKKIGGSHWTSCIILPKRYISPNGRQINNDYEKIYVTIHHV